MFVCLRFWFLAFALLRSLAAAAESLKWKTLRDYRPVGPVRHAGHVGGSEHKLSTFTPTAKDSQDELKLKLITPQEIREINE